MTREFTNRMVEMLEEGSFNKDLLIQDLLSYLSEDEVKDFVQRNDFIGFEDLGFRSSLIEPEDDIYGDNALEEDFA